MGHGKQEIPSDIALVRAMASGETDALRALSTRYGGMLAALARRFLRDQSDAEEVAADVLWQCWREAKNFDPARSSVSVWIVTIARSRAIDRLRVNRVRSMPQAEQPAADPVADPSMEVHLAERARLVRSALADLDSNQSAALQLAYFSDLSQSEIAEKLAIPLGTVKTRTRNALIKLREALSGRRD